MIAFNNCRVMVVVAHPDDELLGIGGTLHQLSAAGIPVHVVILGEGITSRSNTRDNDKWKSELDIHKGNIESARLKIGYQSVSVYNFPDNRFDTVALLDIIKVIEKEKNIFQPDVIFTHHGGDVNIDHQRTFEAVITACRPLTTERVHTIITFETASGTEWRASSDPKHFVPNFFVEISKDDLKAKVEGMECYDFEKRAFPHPRSSEALMIQAKRWGIVVGVPHAEAFCIVRKILKQY